MDGPYELFFFLFWVEQGTPYLAPYFIIIIIISRLYRFVTLREVDRLDYWTFNENGEVGIELSLLFSMGVDHKK